MIRNFLFIFVFPMVCALANEPATFMARDLEASSIIQVVVEQAESIEYFDGNKLYLKARNIRHTNVGLALCNEHSTILLPRLSVDQNGYYLSYRDEDHKLTCTKCGYEWSIFIHASEYCPRCGGIGE
jgi:hypothetical protein